MTSAAPAGEPQRPRNIFRTGLLAEVLSSQGQALSYLGFRIFKWLLALVALMAILLSMYVALTYPDVTLYVPRGQAATAEQAQLFETAKAAWTSQVKDFAQLFLLGPVFPLIGAVLGYIFGREKPASTDKALADRAGAEKPR